MPDYPILDRQPYFDDESRSYGIRTYLGDSIRLRKRMWKPGDNILDQGREGQCVVFGWGGELAASPHRYDIDDEWCRQCWPMIVAKDREMGNDFPEGASVLAGAKCMRMLGHIKSYRWGFGLDDVLQTLSRRGPVVLGINWYASMYSTDDHGLVTVEGERVGAHCILASGIWPNHPFFETDVVAWTNSWGPSYGINGRGFIPTSELGRLLHEDGEACIPVDRPVKSRKKEEEEYDGD